MCLAHVHLLSKPTENGDLDPKATPSSPRWGRPKSSFAPAKMGESTAQFVDSSGVSATLTRMAKFYGLKAGATYPCIPLLDFHRGIKRQVNRDSQSQGYSTEEENADDGKSYPPGRAGDWL